MKMIILQGIVILALLGIALICRAADSVQSLFAYDSKGQVTFTALSSKTVEGVSVKAIVFQGTGLSGKVGAILIEPKQPGAHPAVIYLHMYPGTNEQFYDEGIALAKKGTVCLLVEGLFPWREMPTNADHDRKTIIRQIIELRRAVDLLCALKNVDAKRIAFVGMDYGAMHGMVLSAVDTRILFYVIIAGVPTYSQWNGVITREGLNPEYIKKISDLDPINYLPRTTAKGFLFQYSENDEWVTKEDFDLLYASVNRPKDIKWYESGHEAIGANSLKDRIAWLIERLEIK
jgi:dienelactone hydrolase